MDYELKEADQPVLAMVAGKAMTEVPADLFIPPDALVVLLDSFSGPLDLLLYLIRKQNIDILNIPIVLITRQYLQYIQLMEQNRLELAADYLVMAATLAEIKSRLLLPAKPQEDEELEEDPRLALVRKLQLYEQFKMAAENLDALPRCERDSFRFAVNCTNLELIKTYAPVSLEALIEAMAAILKREQHQTHHRIRTEVLSVRERMGLVLDRLTEAHSLAFTSLLNRTEGRLGLVVTFMAILELARQSLLVITQVQSLGSIHVEAVKHGE